MTIRIHMSGPGADQELSSLYTWLQDEPDIRRHARTSLVAAEPRPSEMGTALEVIQLVVDGGFQAMNFAVAYATWRSTRPRHPRVTIDFDDVCVTLEGVDEDAVEAIIHALT